MTACPLQRQPRWTDDSTLDDVLHLMEQVAETILLKENVELPFDRQEREELRASYRDWLIEAAENTDLCLHYNRYMALRDSDWRAKCQAADATSGACCACQLAGSALGRDFGRWSRDRSADA